MKRTGILLTIGLAALLFNGCAQNEVKPSDCGVDSYFEAETKMCKPVLAKITGVIREVRTEIILVSMEDNSIIKLKKGQKDYKVGDLIKIIVKK